MSVCYKEPVSQDYIDMIAAQWGIDKEYARHMLLAFGLSFVNDYVMDQWTAQGCTGKPPRKPYVDSAFALWLAYPMLRQMKL